MREKVPKINKPAKHCLQIQLKLRKNCTSPSQTLLEECMYACRLKILIVRTSILRAFLHIHNEFSPENYKKLY